MRWLMCLTEAAFTRTAWGSRVSDEPPNPDREPGPGCEPCPEREPVGAPDCCRTSFRLASEADAVAAAATWAGDVARAREAGAGAATRVTGVVARSGFADTIGMAAVAGSDAG